MTVLAPMSPDTANVSLLPSRQREREAGPIEKVLVIDGDAISPMVASFLAGPNDYVLFASNKGSDTSKLSDLLNGCRAELWQVPIHSQAADMALAFYVGKALTRQPALREARWLFVSSDKSFGVLKPLLVEEGVNSERILQVKVESIKQAGDRVLSSTLHAIPASERKTTGETISPCVPSQGKTDEKFVSKLARQVWQAANDRGGMMLPKEHLIHFIYAHCKLAPHAAEVAWAKQLHAELLCFTTTGKITKHTVAQWVIAQGYVKKGNHIGV